MHYIRRLLLVFALIGQVLYPTQAYAYIPPPLLYAGVTSVTAHAGLLLLEFGSFSFGGAPAGGGGTSGGGSSAGGGGTSGGRPTHPGFGPGGAGAGGVPVNLTPDTTYIPAGWGPKPDAAAGAGGSGSGAGGTSGSSGARPGRPIPYPPEVAAKKGTCYYSDGSANPPTCQQQCALRGYKSGPDPSDCYYEGSLAASVPHFYKDACPKGYRQEGATCKLTNYRDVEKPPKTPCEPVRINGKFQLDPNNPECAKYNNTLPEANGCQSEISAGVYQLHCVGSDVNITPAGIEISGPNGSAGLPFSSGASGASGGGGGGPPIIEVPADKPMKFPGPILPVTVDEITNYSCDSQGLCNPTGSASGGSSASGSTGGSGSSPGGSGAGTGSSSAGGGAGGSSGGGGAGSSGPGSGGANFPGSGGSGSSGTPGGTGGSGSSGTPGGTGGTGSSGTPGGTGGTGSSGTPGGTGGTDAPGGTGGTGGTPGSGTGGTGSSGTPGGIGGTDAPGGTGGTPGSGAGGTPGAGTGGTPGSGSGATPGTGSGSGSGSGSGPSDSGDGWLGAIVSKFDAVIGAIGGVGESVKSMPDKIAESIGSAFGLSGVDSNADISIPTVSAGDKYDRHDFELMRSCPAPLVLNLSLAGQQVFTFQYVCEFAATLRPLVLASAYLSAFYIVFVYRED